MSTSAPTNKNIHIKKLREGIAGFFTQQAAQINILGNS